MTYEEVKQCFNENVNFLYWDVTKEELSTIPVNKYMGYYLQTMYVGTEVEVPELSNKLMQP